MFEVEKVNSFLNKNFEGHVPERELVFRIPDSQKRGDHIYDKYVLDSKFIFQGKNVIRVPEWTKIKNYRLLVDKLDKNTFTSAILNAVIPEFRYFSLKSRVQFIKDFYRQMAVDLEEKNLYKDLKYHAIRNKLRETLQGFFNADEEEVMRKYLVDYLSLKVYIIEENNDATFLERKVSKIEYLEEYQKNTIFLVKYENKYCLLVNRDMTGMIDDKELEKELNGDFEKLIKINAKKVKIPKKVVTVEKVEENLEKKEEILENLDELSEKNELEEPVKKKEKIKIPAKATLKVLQELAEQNGISLTKKSEKTGKDIKKTIQELKLDLENL